MDFSGEITYWGYRFCYVAHDNIVTWTAEPATPPLIVEMFRASIHDVKVHMAESRSVEQKEAQTDATQE